MERKWMDEGINEARRERNNRFRSKDALLLHLVGHGSKSPAGKSTWKMRKKRS